MKTNEKVAKLLEEKGICQREFAEMIGVTELSLWRFLSRNRPQKATILLNMATALCVPIEEIIGDDVAEESAEYYENLKKEYEEALKTVGKVLKNKKVCWCHTDECREILFDENHDFVYGLDPKGAWLNIRISPKQGVVGLPINFCPYCGRMLSNEFKESD